MTIPRLRSLRALEILDSRGNPTIEVTVTLSNHERATAAVPSGASTGQFEARELRDAHSPRYGGKEVLSACKNIETEILDRLRGMKITDQREIDERMCELDGTPTKSRLGANAILGVSLACARAGADASGVPLYRYLRSSYALPFEEFLLPEPMMNIINGGRHAENGVDFQEYLIIPHARTFSDRMEIGVHITTALKALLEQRELSTLVADEGGFAPHLPTNSKALALLVGAVERTDHPLGKAVHFGIDVAASEFYAADDARYFFALERRQMTSDDLVDLYRDLARKYPLLSIEDGCADTDDLGWRKMTMALKDTLLLVGDDLFVTNRSRLEDGIANGIANAILIKPNQVGTLSETIDTIRCAQTHHYTPMISHRSGETTDSFIADLAVAVNAPYIKAGAPVRGERLAKYNRLLEIERELA
ncbi:MAG: phosphopyruvate hydratase [bacterium]